MKKKYLALSEYQPVFQAMEQFTLSRSEYTEDELWVLEHPPVFTQGLAGKPEHLLIQNSGIPVVKIDRGGQITYHGPGQLIVYTLINFKLRRISVRELVRILENSVIATLNDYGLDAHGDVDAPGVYVGNRKISSLGLRIRNGAVYHGLSLNVDMDLAPFSYINPCGHSGLQVTQLADLVDTQPEMKIVADQLICHLENLLPNYESSQF